MKHIFVFCFFISIVLYADILEELNNYRKNKVFTDIKIVSQIDGKEFDAHKLVIWANLKYFKDISKLENNIIELNYSGNFIEKILNSAYKNLENNINTKPLSGYEKLEFNKFFKAHLMDNFINEINRAKNEELFTDVEILSELDGSIHRAHKNILSANSMYFKDILQNNVIYLKYSENAIKNILNFIYNKKEKLLSRQEHLELLEFADISLDQKLKSELEKSEINIEIDDFLPEYFMDIIKFDNSNIINNIISACKLPIAHTELDKECGQWTKVYFNSDGSKLTLHSINNDTTKIKILDAKSLQTIHAINGKILKHSENISIDRSKIFTINLTSSEIKIFDTENKHRPVVIDLDNQNIIIGGLFSRDNSKVITMSIKRDIAITLLGGLDFNVYDAVTGNKLFHIAEHCNMNALAKKSLRKGTIQLIEQPSIICIALDSKKIAVFSNTSSSPKTFIYDLDTGEKITTLIKADFHSPFFNEDSSMLVTTYKNEIIIYDTTAWNIIIRLPKTQQEIAKIYILNNGNQVFILFQDKGVKAEIWDIHEQKAIFTIHGLHGGFIPQANHDGKKIMFTKKTGTIMMYDIQKNKVLFRLNEQPQPLKSASFSNQNYNVITVSGNMAKIWLLEPGQLFFAEKLITSEDSHYWLTLRYLLNIYLSGLENNKKFSYEEFVNQTYMTDNLKEVIKYLESKYEELKLYFEFLSKTKL